MTKDVRNKFFISGGVFLLLLILDQWSKFYVKTHFILGESVEVFDWFYIRFIENNGMAFGIELFDKFFLTSLRIVAVAVILYYLIKIVKKGLNIGYIIGVTMLLAGALGNIIDCIFYGVWFDSSYGQIAEFLPAGGGYSNFFYGKVVDMLYFPLIDTILPSWLPFWGGERFTFFDPVFNIADSAICISVAYLIHFQYDTLNSEFSSKLD